MWCAPVPNAWPGSITTSRPVGERRLPRRPDAQPAEAPAHVDRPVVRLPALRPVVGDLARRDVDERAARHGADVRQRRQLARRAVDHVLDRVAVLALLEPAGRELEQLGEHRLGVARAPTRIASRITPAPSRPPPSRRGPAAPPRAARAARTPPPPRRRSRSARRRRSAAPGSGSSGRAAIAVSTSSVEVRDHGRRPGGVPPRCRSAAWAVTATPFAAALRSISAAAPVRDLDRVDRREPEPRGGHREDPAAGAPVAQPAGELASRAAARGRAASSGACRRRTARRGRSRSRARRRRRRPAATAGGPAAAARRSPPRPASGTRASASPSPARRPCATHRRARRRAGPAARRRAGSSAGGA